ncbi:MAG TPA: tetratricopeptide repeat protein [Ramlibacter sp.]|nr:tetratricopeptide repeat protein [Ramlibacter sp.]
MTSQPPAQRLAALVRAVGEGRHAEAEAGARELLRQHPGHPGLWKILGGALAGTGRHEESVEAKRRCVELSPADGEAQSNLGNSLMALGRTAEALQAFEEAVRLAPAMSGGWLGRIRANMVLGRKPAALAAAREFLAREGVAPATRNLVGNLLREMHEMAEARACYERALQEQPVFPEAATNLGNTLVDLGKPSQAEAWYRKAMGWAPRNPAIHSNLGNLLREQGRLAEAQACHREALRLQPRFLGAHSNLLMSMNHDADTPPKASLEQARRFGEEAMAGVGAPMRRRGALSRRPDGRLRVGLVSGDLRSHPVGYFVQAWVDFIAEHGVDLFAFPTVAREDALTTRLKPAFRGWQALWDAGDDLAARRIAERDVDVLLDLSGHTGHNRLGVFARRPAPVQATWLGYFGTTGLPTLDWLLADRASVAPEDHANFSEGIWYLPHRLCFAPPQDAAEVAPTPALQRGQVTFGSFQSLGKLRPPVLAAWARVLKRVPGSRLRLQSAQLGDPEVAQRQVQQLVSAGISPARLSLHGRMPRRQYLAAHAEVDILLDTFPYPGGTTTCEALWMGVPTVTLRGDRLLARQGSALMRSAQLEDWVAEDVDGYVELAVRRAADVQALAALRSGLRAHVAASPLFDGRAFARDLAGALREMARATPAGPT